jgi:peptidoglycan L-alanyl-D-glutamate endopeptidase CwlK
MKLSEKQAVFLNNMAILIIWGNSQEGWYLTGGELQRSEEQQKIYFESGASKTMDSKHIYRLAMDLNLFINGEYQTDREAYKPLADFWKSLHKDNVAGYDWGWDANHFEMN